MVVFHYVHLIYKTIKKICKKKRLNNEKNNLNNAEGFLTSHSRSIHPEYEMEGLPHLTSIPQVSVPLLS